MPKPTESRSPQEANEVETVMDASAKRLASRRAFLGSGAGLIAGAAAAEQPLFAQPAGVAAGDPELAAIQARRRVLLKGGVVLTLDAQVGDFVRADVLIEDGKIREVRPNIPVGEEAAAIVDATNRIVLPGFIDSHHHFYQGILRNILTNGLLNPDYGRDVSGTLTAAYQPSDVYAGVLVTALGMIDAGTTAAVDTSQVSHTPEHSDAGIRALQESGLRAVYAYSRGAGPNSRYPDDIARLQRTTFSSSDQLLTLALGGTLDARIFAVAREAGVPAVSHGVNGDTERALVDLGRRGLLQPGDEYIHCTQLSGIAWRLIKDTGGHVSLAPPIEMAMGHGMPAIQDAIDHGIRPSLSSDVDVTMAQDPFTIMRAAFTLQRLMVLQRRRAGEANLPRLLTCREVLEFATIEGARCALIDRKVGTLTPGKEADIVMLRADRINVWPLNNAPGVVVNLMNPSNVENVFIAGKIKKWRGNLVGIDMGRVLRLAELARDGVLARANFRANLLG
ncbi:MAG TPA: amidohydrolase family protein [Xanthobacteraceae bacterium]|nr:amidohydrolase family protein [Xanthobacteraceae bacterium]